MPPTASITIIINQQVAAKIFQYLDEHQDLIKFAKKGYVMCVRDKIYEALNYDLTYHQAKKVIHDYRVDRKVSIQLMENKYYKRAGST